MGAALRIRLAAARDSEALAELMARSPDAGRVAFSYRFSADLLTVMRALATHLDGAVALEDGRIVGMILGDFARVQCSGARRPGVYVSNLRVDPDLRRRGVARELARWGLAHVDERLGPDAVVYSAVLAGNVSTPLIERLGFQATDSIRGALVPLRRRPPRAAGDLCVRPASAADWPALADGMNAFYAEHNLWSPVSVASLEDFAGREIAGLRPNRWIVVTRSGELVGGLSVSDRRPLVRMVVTRASLPVRLAGRALGILPADGALRALTIRHVWFRPDALDAARFLFQTLRFGLRERGSCLGIAWDPRDRVAEAYQLPRWLPAFPARYLVRAPERIEAERPTYCIAGA